MFIVMFLAGCFFLFFSLLFAYLMADERIQLGAFLLVVTFVLMGVISFNFSGAELEYANIPRDGTVRVREAYELPKDGRVIDILRSDGSSKRLDANDLEAPTTWSSVKPGMYLLRRSDHKYVVLADSTFFEPKKQ